MTLPNLCTSKLGGLSSWAFKKRSQVTMFFHHDSFTLIEDILVQDSDVFVQAGNPKFVCSSLREGITDKYHLLLRIFYLTFIYL
ncbi:hypothetical protein Sjap_023767 [Stephania japonica]|uniref:Uncharacterized protein n=1 Tax=Stephania japonica TaxID=461633 RepID=A0AAP0EEB4_9MAGN